MISQCLAQAQCRQAGGAEAQPLLAETGEIGAAEKREQIANGLAEISWLIRREGQPLPFQIEIETDHPR